MELLYNVIYIYMKSWLLPQLYSGRSTKKLVSSNSGIFMSADAEEPWGTHIRHLHPYAMAAMLF